MHTYIQRMDDPALEHIRFFETLKASTTSSPDATRGEVMGGEEGGKVGGGLKQCVHLNGFAATAQRYMQVLLAVMYFAACERACVCVFVCLSLRMCVCVYNLFVCPGVCSCLPQVFLLTDIHIRINTCMHACMQITKKTDLHKGIYTYIHT